MTASDMREHLHWLEASLQAGNTDHWIYTEAAQLALELGLMEKAARYINQAIANGYPYLTPIQLTGEPHNA